MSAYFYTRDVSHAYVQSDTTTQRPTYVLPPRSLNISLSELLRTDRALCGILEAELYWYCTYHNHHQENLLLSPANHDSCILYISHGISMERAKTSAARRFTYLRTDDTASTGNDVFIDQEYKMASRYDCRPTMILRDGNHLTFNGAKLGMSKATYSISQPDWETKTSKDDKKQRWRNRVCCTVREGCINCCS